MGATETILKLRKQLAEQEELGRLLAKAILEESSLSVADAISKALERPVQKSKGGIPQSGAGDWSHMIAPMHAASKARKKT
jgi:hypothetical protein